MELNLKGILWLPPTEKPAEQGTDKGDGRDHRVDDGRVMSMKLYDQNKRITLNACLLPIIGSQLSHFPQNAMAEGEGIFLPQGTHNPFAPLFKSG